jgi:hypothetical protein
VVEICGKLGIAETAFYRWKKQFGSPGVTEFRGHLLIFSKKQVVIPWLDSKIPIHPLMFLILFGTLPPPPLICFETTNLGVHIVSIEGTNQYK